jgi:hypothetical protein
VFHVKQSAALGLGIAAFLIASAAKAETEQVPSVQWNTSVTVGLARYGDNEDLWRASRFAGSLRADFLFGRTQNASFGFGPTTFVGFSTYSELNLGAGAQLLIPVHDYLPITLGAGLYGVNREDQKTRPGTFLALGWGPRSFNYHSSYSMGGGLLLEARRDLSESPVTTWLASVQIDSALLALPVVFVVNAFRLPPTEVVGSDPPQFGKSAAGRGE